MDANETRFHLFLGYGDWSSCLDEGQRPLRETWETSPAGGNDSGLAWDSEHAELTLQPRLFQFVAAPQDIPPTIDQRRGAARDRYGNWYWIDESRGQILVNSVGTGTTAAFWPDEDRHPCPPAPRLGDFQPQEPPPAPVALSFSGLTVSEEHYLVVGVLAPAGLLIFDLHAGGPPQQLLWPAPVPFVPFDLTPMPGGGVWILDRTNRCYWALDRHFNVLRTDQAESPLGGRPLDDFQPLAGEVHSSSTQPIVATGLTQADALPLPALDPIAIEALPDCTVLILDRNPGQPFSLIYRYHFGRQLGEAVSTSRMTALIEEEKQADFRLLAHDFAFVPEHESEEGKTPDRLYVVAVEGNQAFAFTIGQVNGQLTLLPLAEYFPIRLFGGKGLVAAGGGAYYDFGAGWIPLVQQPRPRYVENALLYTPVKDGREPDCVWHRLLLDACIPAETEVRVWSRAANETRALELAAWQPEPHLYLRSDGSEQPYLSTQGGENRGTWELLLQRARGRYLQLCLELHGNGQATMRPRQLASASNAHNAIELRGSSRVSPRLHAMRIYYPRFSYLNHYLPAIYQEESQSASFLDRFLANLEGFYTALEDKIAVVQLLFDVRSAPPATLEWLASWFDVALDPAWDETRRRLLIRHALDFFQWRGTSRGLLMALRLTMDECPDESIFNDQPMQPQRGGAVRIIEKYRTRSLPNVVLGDATELSGLRQITPATRWQPAQGGAELQRRYSEFLLASGQSLAALPVQAPTDPATALAWAQFARDSLGFVPAATSADEGRWQDFLARRYQRIGALNDAYALIPAQRLASFAQAPLPNELPADGAPLLDWYQFEAIVLAMRRSAHQFSVLLPQPKASVDITAEHSRRLELAKRMIDLEKPAHTIFDVKFYWALFRVGAARLGEDTLLDRGSRAPELMPPLVLGQGYLAEAFLAPGHPQNVTGRQVVGGMALTK